MPDEIRVLLFGIALLALLVVIANHDRWMNPQDYEHLQEK